jgi:hypothetical protein
MLVLLPHHRVRDVAALTLVAVSLLLFAAASRGIA